MKGTTFEQAVKAVTRTLPKPKGDTNDEAPDNISPQQLALLAREVIRNELETYRRIQKPPDGGSTLLGTEELDRAIRLAKIGLSD